MPGGPRYDDDFYAWTQHRARVLRSLRTRDSRFDREHVAEEIEDLGKSERDVVRSQITRAIEHFLKLAHSPADRPRYGWMRSIMKARAVLRNKSPSTLRRDADATLAILSRDARGQGEPGLREQGEDEAAAWLPATCPHTIDQIFAADWYPEPAGEPE